MPSLVPPTAKLLALPTPEGCPESVRKVLEAALKRLDEHRENPDLAVLTNVFVVMTGDKPNDVLGIYHDHNLSDYEALSLIEIGRATVLQKMGF